MRNWLVFNDKEEFFHVQNQYTKNSSLIFNSMFCLKIRLRRVGLITCLKKLGILFSINHDSLVLMLNNNPAKKPVPRAKARMKSNAGEIIATFRSFDHAFTTNGSVENINIIPEKPLTHNKGCQIIPDSRNNPQIPISKIWSFNIWGVCESRNSLFGWRWWTTTFQYPILYFFRQYSPISRGWFKW